jgi:hypothetical protein
LPLGRCHTEQAGDARRRPSPTTIPYGGATAFCGQLIDPPEPAPIIGRLRGSPERTASGSPLRSPPVAEEIRRRPLPEPYAFTKIKGIGSKSQGLEALPVKPAIGWIDIVEEGQMFDRVLG